MLRRLLETITLLTALLVVARSANAIDDIGPTNRVWLQGTSETYSAGFQNAGTLLFESIDDAYNVSLYVTEGAITNLPTGLIQFLGGAGGARFLGADIINEGTFDTSYGVYLTRTNGLFYQRSLLNVATNIPFLYYCTNGYFFQEAGALAITGRFELNFATFVYSGGIITGVPRLINSALQINPSATNAATFQINGTVSQLLGNVTPEQIVRILGSATDGPGYLTSTNGFRNDGTIYLDSTNSPYDSQLLVLAGALTNSPLGAFYSTVGAGANRAIQGDVLNLGEMMNETVLTITSTGKGFVNSGVLTLSGDQLLTLESDFTQTSSGSLRLVLGQPDPSFQTDSIAITQTARLDGRLELSLADGYTPAFGDSFGVLTCARRIGFFKSSNLPALPPGLDWKISYRNDAVIVSVDGRVQSPVIEQFSFTPGGGLHLICSGTPASSLVVQSSPDLKTWSGFVTNRPFPGFFEFVSTNGSRVPKQFFRAVVGP